jgi:hypothetical protein
MSPLLAILVGFFISSAAGLFAEQRNYVPAFGLAWLALVCFAIMVVEIAKP